MSMLVVSHSCFHQPAMGLIYVAQSPFVREIGGFKSLINMTSTSTNILILYRRNLRNGVMGEMVMENKEPGKSCMLPFYYVDNINLQYLKNTYFIDLFLSVVHRCFIRYNIGHNTQLFIWNISNART